MPAYFYRLGGDSYCVCMVVKFDFCKRSVLCGVDEYDSPSKTFSVRNRRLLYFSCIK